MSGQTICIVLPALNEEENIGKVIAEIPRAKLEERGYTVRVLVVDNNSTDKTGKVAEENGAEVIIETEKGKGCAMRTGFKQSHSDFVFMLDADYTYPGNFIPDMLDVLLDGYDVVIGSRLKGSRAKGSISRMNIVGNHLLTTMAAILYFHRISDLCTGYWGFKGEVLPKLRLSASGFELEADLFTQVVKRGYRLGEVPIYYRRRGTPTKLNSIKSGFRIAWKLIAGKFR